MHIFSHFCITLFIVQQLLCEGEPTFLSPLYCLKYVCSPTYAIFYGYFSSPKKIEESDIMYILLGISLNFFLLFICVSMAVNKALRKWESRKSVGKKISCTHYPTQQYIYVKKLKELFCFFLSNEGVKSSF